VRETRRLYLAFEDDVDPALGPPTSLELHGPEVDASCAPWRMMPDDLPLSKMVCRVKRFMQPSTSIPTLAIALATSILVAACGGSDPGGPSATATVSGVVRAASGAVIEGASTQCAGT
jgi:hypothetical protein